MQSRNHAFTKTTSGQVYANVIVAADNKVQIDIYDGATLTRSLFLSATENSNLATALGAGAGTTKIG